ncbi:putative AC transposase [Glycine soja]|uniref:Putative AC transposase n=1 Tax=Glycine soja TaxID=3848 RepID=A0A445KZX4_GLYSO|nr:putative AC transposase [Glycine soja]
MIHLQLAFPLYVTLKVHHNKGHKLFHNHKDMQLHHNKGKDNNLNLHKQRGRAYCKYCNASYATTSSIYETSNLRRNVFQQCKKNPHRQADKKQKTVFFGSDSESDPNKVSMKLFVENEGFRKFMEDAQPKFKIPSHVTIARYCIHVFNDEKEKLKHVLSTNKQMISLTTDTWTITLESCLKEWGISKVCCVTVDNASANNLAISYLLNGEFMHMRCSAHILNLIVSDELKEIDLSIRKIRASCKFVKSSLHRFANFKRCAKEVSVSIKVMLILDVPTKWNSTYLMLDVAEKYEHAFYLYEYVETAYVLNLISSEGDGCPKEIDWQRARVFISFLKTFYDATLSFYGSLHVTANTFFNKLVSIQTSLNKWRHSDDLVIQRMTTNMQLEFNKYWESCGINYLFLDPCYKSSKYYILSCMARDILVILVSLESAFSKGGRILYSLCSSLIPTTVEALICAQN